MAAAETPPEVCTVIYGQRTFRIKLAGKRYTVKHIAKVVQKTVKAACVEVLEFEDAETGKAPEPSEAMRPGQTLCCTEARARALEAPRRAPRRRRLAAPAARAARASM